MSLKETETETPIAPNIIHDIDVSDFPENFFIIHDHDDDLDQDDQEEKD